MAIASPLDDEDDRDDRDDIPLSFEVCCCNSIILLLKLSACLALETSVVTVFELDELDRREREVIIR